MSLKIRGQKTKEHKKKKLQELQLQQSYNNNYIQRVTCFCFHHRHSQQQYQHTVHLTCHIFLQNKTDFLYCWNKVYMWVPLFKEYMITEFFLFTHRVTRPKHKLINCRIVVIVERLLQSPFHFSKVWKVTLKFKNYFKNSAFPIFPTLPTINPSKYSHVMYVISRTMMFTCLLPCD